MGDDKNVQVSQHFLSPASHLFSPHLGPTGLFPPAPQVPRVRLDSFCSPEPETDGLPPTEAAAPRTFPRLLIHNLRYTFTPFPAI